MRRRCDNCKTPLRKGHGFVSANGRLLLCGRSYTFGTGPEGGFIKKRLGCNKW